MHSAICETYLVQWYSIDLLSIGVGVDVSSVYVHSAICETYLVQMVFHRSIVNWTVGGDVFSVYVHSAICDTYLV